MWLLRKVLFNLLFVGLIIGANYTYALDPVPARQITGTWLYLWWHGEASVVQTDGTAVTKLVFLPESYREADDQKSESFLRFREDGTGTFFKRYIVFNNNGGKITVVTKDRNGQWVKGDRPELKTDFAWEVKGDQIIIRSRGEASGFHKNGQYHFVFNAIPTRLASRSVMTRLRLNDELIIYLLGQFLKVGREAEQSLLQRYGIL
jgi:hypothetical protein